MWYVLAKCAHIRLNIHAMTHTKACLPDRCTRYLIPEVNVHFRVRERAVYKHALWVQKERREQRGLWNVGKSRRCRTKIFVESLYVDGLEVSDVHIAHDILDYMVGESDVGVRENGL